MRKRLLFVTGTRADFGKLRPLIDVVQQDAAMEVGVFATGMHTMAQYGYTVNEVLDALPNEKLGFGLRQVFPYMNQSAGESMENTLANTIHGLSRYVQEFKPDLIVVHGDRVEALAGAIVGSLRNILVAHIEGGEISGTVDELIRHAVTKMAHIHFVANDTARRRLCQLGEGPESIFVIGSPNIDVMLGALPELAYVKSHYDLSFASYGIVIYHPVTTDLHETALCAKQIVDALLRDKGNVIVIMPNNDMGTDLVRREFERLTNQTHVRMFPSLRFEYYLVLLRSAEFILGNSSSGIMEAPIYGVPTINVSSRQRNRFDHESILQVQADCEAIISAMQHAREQGRFPVSRHYGKGNSATVFLETLHGEALWQTRAQKQFIDLA